MGLTLSVGADESNHGSKVSKEIVVATFSLLRKDRRQIYIPVRRDFEAAEEYLDCPGKGWVFTLNGKLARESLTFEVPGLIDYWIRKNDLGKKVTRIAAAFDGTLGDEEQAQFMEEMLGKYNFGGKADMRHHAKGRQKGKKVDRSYDSQLVWAADSIARKLFTDFHRKMDLEKYRQYVSID